LESILLLKSKALKEHSKDVVKAVLLN